MNAKLPLHALRAFQAAATLGSFKAAAAQLGVTPGAISQQVRLLEDSLGVRLFERSNRQIRLTPAGQELAWTATDAFDRLDLSVSRLTDKGLPTSPSVLTLSVAPSFAAKWLAPRLHRFRAAHPNLEVRVFASEDVVDLGRAPDFDAALRYGSGPYPSLHAERLWQEDEIFAVCSPHLRQGKPPLRDPADLLEEILFRTRANPASPTQTEGWSANWRRWLLTAGVDQATVAAAKIDGPMFGGIHLALEAAAAGHGVALAHGVLVDGDLRQGRLVRPFETALVDPLSYWFVATPARMAERRVRVFLAWLRQECSA